MESFKSIRFINEINQDYSDAHISARMEFKDKDEDLDNQIRKKINGSLVVSDCSRKVTLDLDVYNDQEYCNVMSKLDNIIEVCAEAREWLKQYKETEWKSNVNEPLQNQ